MEGILRFRHNVMNVTAIDAFEHIKGGINNQCKDVYFVRAVGTGPAYIRDIRKMDETLDGSQSSGRGYYRRLGGLPKLQDMADTAYYAECHAKWLQGGKREAVTRVTEGNAELAKLLGNACASVEGICMGADMGMTDSIRKNFMVKLFFWYDSVFDRENFVWDGRKSIKIVAENIGKKQEYLFFYLLTLTGCDVLLLQSRTDIGAEEEKLGLSAKFVLGDYSDLVIPPYVRAVGTGNHNGAVKERKPGTGTEPGAGRGAGTETGTLTGAQAAAAEGSQIPSGPVVVTIPPRRPGSRAHSAASAAVLDGTGRNGHGRINAVPVNADVEKSFEELARLASSVVMIAIHDGKGDVIGTGSGIMVGREGYILTNNHVASGGKYYSVRIEDDERVYDTDEVIKYNYVLDLAVIRIQRKLVPLPVYQGKKELVRGQKVVAIGSPLGLFNSVSDGIISGFRKIDNVDMIQFTAPTSHGSSGGAVLNMQGEVIGISTAGYDSGQNINLAVGYECINTFIRGFT